MIRKLILYLLDSPVRGAYTMFMEGDKMFSIGEFSKMAKTTVKTLRHYDEIGLLAPAYVDTYSKYRFYTSNQLIIIHQIQSLRQIGLSLDEIQTVSYTHLIATIGFAIGFVVMMMLDVALG